MSLFAKSWDRAAQQAAEQDATAQALLLGKLTLKAAADPQFKQELQNSPTSTIEREAASLAITPTDKTVAEVKRALSAAVPGADTEKVQRLIFDTIDDMRRSFKLTLELSRWLFIAGLVMVALAFAAALFSDKSWAVGVSGGSGVLSLLLSAVMNPLDRIRSAAANLAQVQASYLAFYKQLYILGTSADTLNRADAIAYSEQLRLAASSMVQSVSVAIDKGDRQSGHGLFGRGKPDNGHGKGTIHVEATAHGREPPSERRTKPRDGTGHRPDTAAFADQ